MSLWAVIPAQPPELGKSRLAGVLGRTERYRLNQAFFGRTLEITASVLGPERCLVVTRSGTLLDFARARGIAGLSEAAPYGLNQALAQAAEFLARRGAGLVLSISCDLPCLGAADLQALIDAARAADGAAIATDGAGRGTNALVMPTQSGMRYAYGPGSFAAHRRIAQDAGLRLAAVRRPGLWFDVDTPDDLDRMLALEQWAEWTGSQSARV